MHAPRLHVGAPASLPALQFLGAEKSLAGYRSALNARLAHWRPERSVRLNLEAVLDLKFPLATGGAHWTYAPRACQ